MTLSKSQPWATLYQPMNLMPNFSSYSRTWRGKIVRMKNLKKGSRPRRTLKYVASTGTKAVLLGSRRRAVSADALAGPGEWPPLSHRLRRGSTIETVRFGSAVLRAGVLGPGFQREVDRGGLTRPEPHVSVPGINTPLNL